MKNFNLTLALLASVLAGCTQSAPPTPPAPAAAPSAAAVPNTAAQPASTGETQVTLTLGTDGDNLAFDKNIIEVKAGAKVSLTFKNNVKTSGLSHNWVLVKAGQEASVASDAMQAGEDKAWFADGANVIAHTKLVPPGGSDTITFTAPSAGDYSFICTYPGHNMTMKGIFRVK
jgi:azurin